MIGKIKNFFKRRENLFVILAFVMLILTIYIFLFFIIKLGVTINESVEIQEEKTPAIKFDIEGFKKLNLIKE